MIFERLDKLGGGSILQVVYHDFTIRLRYRRLECSGFTKRNFKSYRWILIKSGAITIDKRNKMINVQI
jgi:hypothetical protein